MDQSAILWSLDADASSALSGLKSRPKTLSAWYLRIASGLSLRRWNTRTLRTHERVKQSCHLVQKQKHEREIVPMVPASSRNDALVAPDANRTDAAVVAPEERARQDHERTRVELGDEELFA